MLSCPLQKSSVVSFSGTSHSCSLPCPLLLPLSLTLPILFAPNTWILTCASLAPCCRALLRFSVSSQGTMHLLICLSICVCHPLLWVSTSFCLIHVTLSLLSSLFAQTTCACRLGDSAKCQSRVPPRRPP